MHAPVAPPRAASPHSAPAGTPARASTAPPVPDASRCRYGIVATVFTLLLIAALFAAATGFTTPDSWHYLLLAQSIRHGLGCTEQGAYYAIFPCGYPLVLALVAPATDIATLLVSSKIANLALLFFAFVLLVRSPVGALASVLVVLNPVSIHIYQYTWSENLFLFALAASMWAVANIHLDRNLLRNGALLALFLITGCASRYFFGPFAVVMFVSIALTHGRRTALRVLPAFVAAAIFFVGYQAFNVMKTGFGTGMARIPAPETASLLGYAFVYEVAQNAASIGAAALVLLLLARARPLRWSRLAPSTSAARSQCFLVLAGLGYLLLQFALRALTQYDPFSTRTIGYGLVFLLAGMAGLLLRPHDGLPLYAVVPYGILTILIAQGPSYALHPAALFDRHFDSALRDLQRYRSPPTNADLIVNLFLPRVNPTMEGTSWIYYPSDKKIVTPKGAPYTAPETFAAFRARVLAQHPHSCVLDFTSFPAADVLNYYSEDAFPVDIRFGSNLASPELTWRYRLDPTFRAYLRSRFRPGRYVDCDLQASGP
jgi:hypothetical protein